MADRQPAEALEKLMRGDVAGAQAKLRELAMGDLISVMVHAEMLANVARDERELRSVNARAAGTVPA